MTARLLAFVGLATLLGVGFTVAPTAAQAPGTVRSQGQELGAPPPPPSTNRRALIDYREQMRQFVQNISAFGRKTRPNFIVIPQNGLALVAKIDDLDQSLLLPARTYMRSIDGVLQEAVFYGMPETDRATSEDRRKLLLPLADLARTNGLKVLALEHARTPAAIDDAYRLGGRNFATLVHPRVGAAMNNLPTYPARPFGENADAVLSLGSVRNYAYLRESTAFGREDQFAMTLHDKNFDMIVVDVFHGRQPLSKQAIETLKYKKLGTRRLVLAYMDIGRATTDRYYWKQEWREGSPAWISAPFPNEPDKYFVEFWRPEWQKLIAGDAQSYLAGIIDKGFDGVVLDGIDSYNFFEGGMEMIEIYR